MTFLVLAYGLWVREKVEISQLSCSRVCLLYVSAVTTCVLELLPAYKDSF